MDAFKGNEILRMEKGGNEKWRAFWEKSTGGTWGRGVEGGQMAGFEERYAGSVGEEWKERLSCEVEGREFGGMPEKVVREKKKGGVDGGMGMGARNQKEMNEDFFARKGHENEGRRADLPPSQGGKYAGFGSGGSTATTGGGGGGGGMGGKGEGMPGVDEFQKDPVAALTKGFGWFTTTVGKSAKSVNDGWIQPNVQKVCYHLSLFLISLPSSLDFHPSLPHLITLLPLNRGPPTPTARPDIVNIPPFLNQS